jgi:hypothetical protein
MNLRPSDYEANILPLRHCILVYGIYCVPSCDFPAVSEVTGSRIFRLYLVVTCWDFWPYLQLLAAEFSGRICGVTVSGKGRELQRPEGRDFPAVSVVSGQDFPAVAFLAWVIL